MGLKIKNNFKVLHSYYQEWLLDDYLSTGIYVKWTFIHFLIFGLNYTIEEAKDINWRYKQWCKTKMARKLH